MRNERNGGGDEFINLVTKFTPRLSQVRCHWGVRAQHKDQEGKWGVVVDGALVNRKNEALTRAQKVIEREEGFFGKTGFKPEDLVIEVEKEGLYRIAGEHFVLSHGAGTRQGKSGKWYDDRGAAVDKLHRK